MIKNVYFAHLRIVYSLSFIVLIFLLIPPVDGLLQARIDSQTNNFKKIRVYEEGGHFNALYLYSDPNRYILKIDGRVTFIPTSRISKVIFSE